MNDFLTFMDDLVQRFPVHVEIYYSKVMDWCIRVYRRDCADVYKGQGVKTEGSDVIICDVQHCDMELCFAKAHVAVKEWLLEFNGGY